MEKVFVSYTQRDLQIAEWIAWVLEKERFSVVFRAWGDLPGNWILAMDSAMQEVDRTVAVLSDDYLNSLYGAPEWANAVRRDPKGQLDLLVPVRVAELTRELEGWLALVQYVDLVGKQEAEAEDLLIRRMKGQRTKPSKRPAFRLGSASAERPAASRPKPPYPAEVKDKSRMRRARNLVVRWRGDHALQVDELAAAAERARAWQSRESVELDPEVQEAFRLGGEVAQALVELPIVDLAPCSAHGLLIHGAVWHGAATSLTLINAGLCSHGHPEAVQLGAYDCENLARVLEAGLALCRFDLARLPSGYRRSTGTVPPQALPEDTPLIVIRSRSESALKLCAIGDRLEPLGRFVARDLDLELLCGRRGRDGTADLVGCDSQHLYCWWGSSPQPTMEFDLSLYPISAGFVPELLDTFAVVGSEGGCVLMNAEGTRASAGPVAGGGELRGATVWRDPFEQGHWGVTSLTRDGDVVAWSGKRQAVIAHKQGRDLSEPFPLDPSLLAEWKPVGVAAIWLDGIPCAVIQYESSRKSLLCFLDPSRLTPLRKPVVIPRRVYGLAVGGGRWLVATHLYGSQHGASLWDLRGPCDVPVREALPCKGDVEPPVVLPASGEAFDSLQVHNDFSGPAHLLRCRWPAGTVEDLGPTRRGQLWLLDPDAAPDDQGCAPLSEPYWHATLSHNDGPQHSCARQARPAKVRSNKPSSPEKQSN